MSKTDINTAVTNKYKITTGTAASEDANMRQDWTADIFIGTAVVTTNRYSLVAGYKV